MRRRLAAVAVTAGILYATGACAAEKFGLLFDVQGAGEIRHSDGKVVKLERERHILFPVKEGDRLKTGEKGRIVVVSLRDKTGYELPAATEAVVEENRIKAVKGVVKTHRGYSVAPGAPGGPIGAIVLRGPGDGAALRILAPVKSTVLEDSPELSWSGSCGSDGVSVSVAEGEKVLYRADAARSPIKVPAGALTAGKTYSWSVEGACGRSRSTFTIPSSAEIARIKEEMARRRGAATELPDRMSYLFFLIDNNLREVARAELESLQREYPLNRFLKEL